MFQCNADVAPTTLHCLIDCSGSMRAWHKLKLAQRLIHELYTETQQPYGYLPHTTLKVYTWQDVITPIALQFMVLDELSVSSQNSLSKGQITQDAEAEHSSPSEQATTTESTASAETVDEAVTETKTLATKNVNPNSIHAVHAAHAYHEAIPETCASGHASLAALKKWLYQIGKAVSTAHTPASQAQTTVHDQTKDSAPAQAQISAQTQTQASAPAQAQSSAQAIDADLKSDLKSVLDSAVDLNLEQAQTQSLAQTQSQDMTRAQFSNLASAQAGDRDLARHQASPCSEHEVKVLLISDGNLLEKVEKVEKPEKFEKSENEADLGLDLNYGLNLKTSLDLRVSVIAVGPDCNKSMLQKLWPKAPIFSPEDMAAALENLGFTPDYPTQPDGWRENNLAD